MGVRVPAILLTDLNIHSVIKQKGRNHRALFIYLEMAFSNKHRSQKHGGPSYLFHRHSRSRLLTHRIGGVTCMINPRWRGNRAKNYKTLQGNPCFSRFKTSRCLESLRINIFWKQLIIAEVLSTICVISAEFLVKISLVKCVVNWSLGQFETFVVQNMYF